ncbi:GTP-binding protein [Dimargaris cristalligena]|uniref:Ferrous iron transporter B n=1 Tax=Dimargaris cristalligena TaxID=215637 RepID=A0A4V1J4H5_9FUNG|nr:GTP-binding protein [Dimargaris cristalligena]RKP35579.1 ferrous iron transporter B [Dimargaris cristalligena]|eukprot:RKP35579.1 ferrous iron transporter B [Dimargaris cristalligena]
MSSQKVRKIVVMGSRSVGKSTLIVQFVENFFCDSYYPTIENTFRKIIKYKGIEFECEIFDTAGQDEFTILSPKYAVGVQGYILAYSVDSRTSFEMTKIVRDKILSFFGTNWVPLVLVGNKTDLHSQREVSAEEAIELAKSWNCEAIECSAKTNENIDKIFDQMLLTIEKVSSPPAETRSGCVIF